MRPRRSPLRTAAPAALLVALLAAPVAALRGATPAVDSGSAAAPAAPRTSGPGSPVASLRLLVRTGDRAPDGGTFTVLADPALDDRGDIAFGA
ncbi:MAG TPA: hypothetical protein VKT83_03530, partial [bacterium]|nr:hypothetical protein [bacterium]